MSSTIPAAPKLKEPRVIICARSGKPFEYLGFGRPPMYHPDEQKAVAKDRNRANYLKRKADKPARKPGRPRKVRPEVQASA